MKLFIVFSCLIVAIMGYFVPQEEIYYLSQIHIQCQKESSCGLEYIRNPYQHDNYEPLGRYMLCLAVNYGFMYPDGRFNEIQLKEKLYRMCPDPQIYISTCAVPSINPYQTAVNLWRCLDNSGFHFLNNIVH